jgi:hypothetical protein
VLSVRQAKWQRSGSALGIRRHLFGIGVPTLLGKSMRITDGPTIHYPDRRPLLARVVARVMRVLL